MALIMAEQWVPEAGQRVYERRTGAAVEIMEIGATCIYVRPLRGGVERVVRRSDLVPPDDAPGGFFDWQASRG
ncbi:MULTISPECIES: hypothetical protein [Kitasatospora]|uniref:Uncharacterized protein n=1 Tax=Kitasatospora cathayae TaxID=3004092 RepID=A0ABY7Q4X4_9ACTN|nr:hypothetical protein [Kitasatospora sp. HUAS 3-15]WBP87672.1 hypothetical protein O1G21_18710 [Kitasatospora sp. HUAS 3-15]